MSMGSHKIHLAGLLSLYCLFADRDRSSIGGQIQLLKMDIYTFVK